MNVTEDCQSALDRGLSPPPLGHYYTKRFIYVRRPAESSKEELKGTAAGSDHRNGNGFHTGLSSKPFFVAVALFVMLFYRLADLGLRRLYVHFHFSTIQIDPEQQEPLSSCTLLCCTPPVAGCICCGPWLGFRSRDRPNLACVSEPSEYAQQNHGQSSRDAEIEPEEYSTVGISLKVAQSIEASPLSQIPDRILIGEYRTNNTEGWSTDRLRDLVSKGNLRQRRPVLSVSEAASEIVACNPMLSTLISDINQSLEECGSQRLPDEFDHVTSQWDTVAKELSSDGK